MWPFPEAHGSGAGAVEGCKTRGVRAIDGDRLAAMPRHFGKTHKPEQPMQLQRFGMGKFYERKAVGSHRVFRGDCSRRGIVRERAHVNSLYPPAGQCSIGTPHCFSKCWPVELIGRAGTGFAFSMSPYLDAIHV